MAVAVARAEADKESAALTSATATIGDGTVTDTNAGPPCTSGKLLHIKLIGTFPRLVDRSLGDQPTPRVMKVSAVQITADPVSGKPCMIGVEANEAGTSTPDPGAVLLFTK
ncbi:MAG: hypothetical protein QOI42_1148 [Frankiaceae bacterium]|nr:hypothetical protein [Frankiaceae bacterium]